MTRRSSSDNTRVLNRAATLKSYVRELREVLEAGVCTTKFAGAPSLKNPIATNSKGIDKLFEISDRINALIDSPPLVRLNLFDNFLRDRDKAPLIEIREPHSNSYRRISLLHAAGNNLRTRFRILDRIEQDLDDSLEREAQPSGRMTSCFTSSPTKGLRRPRLVYDPVIFSRMDPWPLDFAIQVTAISGIEESPVVHDEKDETLELQYLQREHLIRLWPWAEAAISAKKLQIFIGRRLNTPPRYESGLYHIIAPVDTGRFPFPPLTPEWARHDLESWQDRFVTRRSWEQFIGRYGYSVPKALLLSESGVIAATSENPAHPGVNAGNTTGTALDRLVGPLTRLGEAVSAAYPRLSGAATKTVPKPKSKGGRPKDEETTRRETRAKLSREKKLYDDYKAARKSHGTSKADFAREMSISKHELDRTLERERKRRSRKP